MNDAFFPNENGSFPHPSQLTDFFIAYPKSNISNFALQMPVNVVLIWLSFSDSMPRNSVSFFDCGSQPHGIAVSSA